MTDVLFRGNGTSIGLREIRSYCFGVRHWISRIMWNGGLEPCLEDFSPRPMNLLHTERSIHDQATGDLLDALRKRA